MRKFAVLASVLLLSTFTQVTHAKEQSVKLDKISFQVSNKQWVSTKTALLTVEVNATLSNMTLVQVRNEIMDKLNMIAKGDWHITQFDRSQDNSGLEKLYVLTQIRIPQEALTQVYNDAKKVSKPGMNYRINSIDFTPSLEEVQLIKNQLRQQLYKQVDEEINRINAVYATSHYTVFRMNFVEGNNSNPMQLNEARKATLMSVSIASPASLTVSNELIMTAIVEAGSNRKGE